MRRLALLLSALAAALAPLRSSAQERKLLVLREDGGPIEYANVIVEGGTNQITDQKGEVSFGVGKHATYTVRILRIGYGPWFGKLELPDTAATLKVTLPFTTQLLKKVLVVDTTHTIVGLQMQGFYDRWLMRQKGLLSATFIGPEEVESRHPSRVSDLLYGRLGVTIVSPNPTTHYAMGYNKMCPMAIVVDGHEMGGGGAATIMGNGNKAPVNLDQWLTGNDVAAIEIYTRGGNMPSSLHVNDSACGVIEIWTGSRKK